MGNGAPRALEAAAAAAVKVAGREAAAGTAALGMAVVEALGAVDRVGEEEEDRESARGAALARRLAG